MNAPLPLSMKADRCVACGMCLPVCPTYRLSRSESDSPRGRIALMRGLLRKDLQPSAMVVSHLDGCLTCRACEAVCPASVPYGDLVDEVRAIFPMNRARPLSTRLLAATLRVAMGAGPFLWRLASYFAHIGRIAPAFCRRLGFAPMGDAGSAGNLASGAVFEPTTQHRGDVALFLGCIARLADNRTLDDAVYVLRTIGYRVHVPPEQRCCGALHWHQGDRRRATRLARSNTSGFSNLAVDHVVSTTTACTAMLRDYGRLFPEDPRALPFGAKVIDINALLDRQFNIELPKTSARIAVHEPCTTRFAFRPDGVGALLNHIAGISLTPLPRDISCCGAAGAHQLLRAAEAKALRADILAAVSTLDPDILVTSNVGCAMHLRTGLAHGGSRCDVLHPVSVIARQLRQMQLEADQECDR